MALQTFLELCDFIPEDVYEEIKPKIEEAMVKYNMHFKRPDDPFPKMVVEHKVKELRAKELVAELIRALRKELDERGYLERKAKPVPRGFELAEPV